jgi:hypothetical protein
VTSGQFRGHEALPKLALHVTDALLRSGGYSPETEPNRGQAESMLQNLILIGNSPKA